MKAQIYHNETKGLRLPDDVVVRYLICRVPEQQAKMTNTIGKVLLSCSLSIAKRILSKEWCCFLSKR